MKATQVLPCDLIDVEKASWERTDPAIGRAVARCVVTQTNVSTCAWHPRVTGISLRTQYHIVAEGTQSPVNWNGTPVRESLRICITDSSVSEREGKGEEQHSLCAECTQAVRKYRKMTPREVMLASRGRVRCRQQRNNHPAGIASTYTHRIILLQVG